MTGRAALTDYTLARIVVPGALAEAAGRKKEGSKVP
jgi:hypothetical protein